jgi:hypothetical protein
LKGRKPFSTILFKILSSIHRMRRSIKTKKRVWIQGLPMDLEQINGVAGILREEFFLLSNTESPKEKLCEMVVTAQRCTATEKEKRNKTC